MIRSFGAIQCPGKSTSKQETPFRRPARIKILCSLDLWCHSDYLSNTGPQLGTTGQKRKQTPILDLLGQ